MDNQNNENEQTLEKETHMRLLDTLMGQRVFLKDTTKLTKDIVSQGKPWSEIQGLYKSNDISANLIATVLNSIFRQKSSFFLLSKDLLEELVKNDTNTKRNTICGTDYKSFRGKYILGSEMLI